MLAKLLFTLVFMLGKSFQDLVATSVFPVKPHLSFPALLPAFFALFGHSRSTRVPLKLKYIFF